MDDDWPSGFVTATATGPVACAGVSTLKAVAEQDRMLAAGRAVPTVTVACGVTGELVLPQKKPEPEMVSLVPPRLVPWSRETVSEPGAVEAVKVTPLAAVTDWPLGLATMTSAAPTTWGGGWSVGVVPTPPLQPETTTSLASVAVVPVPKTTRGGRPLQAKFVPPMVSAVELPRQIGRASWRGRVSISVVAVSLKE